MIGLLDYDMLTDRVFLPYPNLELMKLSRYFREVEKKNHELVTNLNMLDSYEKVFLRSEKPIDKIDKQIISNPLVESGGLYFSGGIYKPFDRKEIEYLSPNISLYKPLLRAKIEEKPNRIKDINNFLDDTYYRMYAGDDKLVIPKVNRNKKVIVYDDRIFDHPFDDILNELISRGCRKVVFKYPVICRSIEDFFMLVSNPKISSDVKYVLDIDFEKESLPKIINQYKNRFKEFVRFNSDISFYFGKNYRNNYYGQEFFINNLLLSLNILYYFWSEDIPIKLKLWNKSNEINNIYHILFQSIERASYQMVEHRSKCFQDYIRNAKVKETYRKLCGNYRDQKELFNQTYINIAKLGYWRLL